MKCLQWIHRYAVDGEPCVLVRNIYPMHRTAAVQTVTSDLDIELPYVPAGATSEFQPLDTRIIGELKSRARADFERMRASTGSIAISYDASVKILADCWNRIPAQHVRKTWQIDKALACSRHRNTKIEIMKWQSSHRNAKIERDNRKCKIGAMRPE